MMNIIVLVSDTFRYDYLGRNGNEWIGTDALDLKWAITIEPAAAPIRRPGIPPSHRVAAGRAI